MIDSRQIAIAFQGALPAPDSSAAHNLSSLLARLRWLLPYAPIHLSTWDDCAAAHYRFDTVAQVADPGPLPAFKRSGAPHLNNVNRQLAGARALFDQVERPYTLKLRLDSLVTSRRFLDLYARHGHTSDGQQRIAVSSFFTLDPRMFEHMAFHVSDWFAFGPTAKVRALWSAPAMPPAWASWYDERQHAPDSGFFDRRYRARFAVEQYIAMHYAAQLGYRIPAFHNEAAPELLASHERFIARELLVVDSGQCGIALPSYAGASRSALRQLGCVDFLDWYLASRRFDPQLPRDARLLAAARRRHAIKTGVGACARLAEPCMPLLTARPLKAGISTLLRASLRLN